MSFISPLSMYPRLQSVFAVIIVTFFFPLLTTFTILSIFISPWLASTKHIKHTRRWRAISSSTFRARTVLITNLRSPESLSLARAFYRAGHRVIGADHEEYYFPIPARFSNAVNMFCRLGKVNENRGRERYVRDLIDIAKKESVELWVNCSNSDVDLEAKEALERETGCKVFQFWRTVTELLGNENALTERIEQLGIKVAERHFITSEDEAFAILYPGKLPSEGKQYTITTTTPTDTSNSEMTLLPLSSQNDIRTYVKTLQPSSSNPLLLQETFPNHEQYTAYALFVHGKPASFVVYPTSTTILTPLLSMSLLAQALLQYTTHLIASLPSSQAEKSGHLTLNFTIPSNLAIPAESKYRPYSAEIKSFLAQVHLLSCTPSLDLGTIALRDAAEDLASAYLSTLPDHEPEGVSNGHLKDQMIVPRPGVRGYYFLGVEVVRLVFVPIWKFLRWEIEIMEVVMGWFEFVGFIIWWREGWWEVWDPWGAWWRYGGFAVWKAVIELWEGQGWNDKNVSSEDTLIGRA